MKLVSGDFPHLLYRPLLGSYFLTNLFFLLGNDLLFGVTRPVECVKLSGTYISADQVSS